jgi:hypothetical protein
MRERSFGNRLTSILLGIITLAACTSDDPVATPATTDSFSGKMASDWIDLQLRYSKESPGFTPPVVSRALGYSGLAFYEAVVHGTVNNQTLVGQLTALEYLPLPEDGETYHWALCGNAAAAQITRKMFENAPATLLPLIDSLEQVYVMQYGDVSLDVAVRSISFGRVIADSLYSYSKTDGGHKAFNRNFPATYVPPSGPGKWQPTNSQLAMLPTWGNNRTFVKDLKTKITHTGYPAFSTDPSSDFYAEASAVYDLGINLTEEQTNIAYYWADEGFVTFTPPGHSLSVYSQLARAAEFNLAQSAVGYVKMGLAVSDAFVYCWYIKYTNNLLRPSQFIQPNIDALWTPLIPNPPFPEYTSGHSTQAGSAAEVLTSIFGDNFTFTDMTHTKLGLGLAPRSFTSFYQMAEESGMSRLYAGIHYMSANIQGRQTGIDIGHEVVSLTFTKPPL